MPRARRGGAYHAKPKQYLPPDAFGRGSPAPQPWLWRCSSGPARGQNATPGTEDPNNWPQYHRTSNGWRYSPLDQINKENVGHLHVAWIIPGGRHSGRECKKHRLSIDGVIYSISAGNRVAAIDGKTGKEIWHTIKLDPLVTARPVCPTVQPRRHRRSSARSSLERLMDVASRWNRTPEKKSGQCN